MLDLKRLQYLEAVHRYKNFTRASEELFVSQPAISTAVAALERESGVKLIQRSRHGLTFTPEGEAFMVQARRVLDTAREAEEFLLDLSDTSRKRLRFGVSPTLVIGILSDLYNDFFSRYPDSDIYLSDGSLYEHIRALQNDGLDISFDAIPGDAAECGMEVMPLAKSAICALLRPDHPLAGRDEITVQELEQEQLTVLFDQSIVSSRIRELFQEQGVPMNVASSHSQIVSMINTVRLVNCVGFINVPPSGTVPHCEGLVLVPLKPALSIEVGFLYKKGKYLNSLARDTIAFVSDYVNRVVETG